MVLRTHGLTKRFGGITAVDDVDFHLAADECCSLIGPNGAGKTTFFNLLTGTLEPTGGRVEYRAGDAEATVDGGNSGDGGKTGNGDGSEAGTETVGDGETDAGGWRDVTDASPHETALLGVHRSYQITNVFPASTVLENVRIAAQAHGGSDSWRMWRNVGAFEAYVEEAHAILERVGLAAYAEEPARNLSHGQKRNLEVAIALAGDPDVLLMDEPTAGVSSDGIDTIVSLIDDVAADHAILLVEHNMDVVMDVSDRIAVLHRGSLIADGEPEAVRNDPEVQRAYLGGYEEAGETTATVESDGRSDADPEVGSS